MAVQAIVSIMLLASLSALFLFLLVPGGIRRLPRLSPTTPCVAALKIIWPERRRAKLQILGKTVAEVTRSGLFIGLFAGVLVGVGTFSSVPHWVALALGEHPSPAVSPCPRLD